MALTSEEKIRTSVLAIFRNLDFLKRVYAKSRRENREYLIVLGKNIRKFYAGEQNEVSIDYVQKFRPENIYAILHTHPNGHYAPSFQDILATDYILLRYALHSIHGVVAENKLILYNHYTIDTTKLSNVFASNLAPTLSTEDRIRIAGAITINTKNLDLSTIPSTIDYFVGWLIYWRVLLFDTFFFNFKELNMYDILKRYALFINRGRQTVDWLDGKKEANVFWFIPEIDTTKGTALWYKVYEFAAEDKVYKAVLRSCGDVTEIEGIKAIELVQQCKTKKLCRVIEK